MTTAKVWTVMSNKVQMCKRYFWSGQNVIQLPKLRNGMTHTWDMGPLYQMTKFWM